MRIETLKNPGVISSGLRLRTEAAKAISAAELHLQSDGKQVLTDFFSDCAVKAGGTVSVALTPTQALVTNAQATLPVTNSAGIAIANATATVAASVLTRVALPATVAAVTNGAKVNAGTVSGTGNFATITVANGVITGIVLSAS